MESGNLNKTVQRINEPFLFRHQPSMADVRVHVSSVKVDITLKVFLISMNPIENFKVYK